MCEVVVLRQRQEEKEQARRVEESGGAKEQRGWREGCDVADMEGCEEESSRRQ